MKRALYDRAGVLQQSQEDILNDVFSFLFSTKPTAHECEQFGLMVLIVIFYNLEVIH
jgi:hypothetical protein